MGFFASHGRTQEGRVEVGQPPVEPLFHQIERTLEVCGVAVWVEVFYDEMSELSNVVVAFCGFSFPQLKVLLPSGAKPRKIRDQSRHDLSFAWLIVVVENPIRIAAHS